VHDTKPAKHKNRNLGSIIKGTYFIPVFSFTISAPSNNFLTLFINLLTQLFCRVLKAEPENQCACSFYFGKTFFFF